MRFQRSLFILCCASVALLLSFLPAQAASRKSDNAILRAQILLDRAHFSVGEIDGHNGGTTRGAIAAFNRARKVKGPGLNNSTWLALNLDTAPVIVPYTLTAEDLGPFTPIPEDMADKAKLPALGYENAAEG